MNSLHSRLSARQHGAAPSAERGAATLAVVMVLFFIVSMVAAYTNRNLVFEQRTSGNQYRSTQALEAADAGLQWALGQLNGGRITASCEPSGNPADTTFRQRYLTIDGTTGAITPNFTGGGDPLWPSCVFDGTNWQCSCPANGSPVLAAPTGSGIFPAYRVRFVQFPGRPGIVRAEVNACTRYAESCLAFPAQGTDNEGRVTVSALVALKGAITTLPAAPLTSRGALDVGGAALTAVNADPAGAGITVHAGGAVNRTNMVLSSRPGTPPDVSVFENDTVLAALDANRMFSNTFGMARDTYRLQPGAVRLDCTGGCGANAVRTAAAANPGRVLWLQGNLDIDSGGDIGSPAEPVALVVTGNVAFSSTVNIYGLIYTQAAAWASSGSSQVRGAAMAEGSMGGATTATFFYDPAVLNRLRLAYGSFAMVPGSWRDFQ